MAVATKICYYSNTPSLYYFYSSKLVMFDPYGHHPLVSESSVDKYQIILPMSFVVNAVILREFVRNSDDDQSLIYHKEPGKIEQKSILSEEDGNSKNGEEKENERVNEQTTPTGSAI